MSFLDNALWAAGFVGHVILLCVILLRRRQREVPVFSIMIALNIIRTCALFLVHRHGGAWAYFYTYWVFVTADTVLYLAVFIEGAAYTYHNADFRARPTRIMSFVLISIGLLIAIIMAWLTPTPGAGFRNALIVRSNLVSSTLLAELFAVMIAFSGRSGVPWRTHPARVIQGLGIYAFIGLLINAAQGLSGISSSPTFRLLSRAEMGIYLLCLGYWIITLYREAPKRLMSDEMKQQLTVVVQGVGAVSQGIRSQANYRE